jgi:hypothetical protein
MVRLQALIVCCAKQKYVVYRTTRSVVHTNIAYKNHVFPKSYKTQTIYTISNYYSLQQVDDQTNYFFNYKLVINVIT